MPGLPAAFTEEHLSLLPQQTLNRLHNLAATLCAALDDEQSRRNAHPRLAEDGLSPHNRTLLSVGSRQLLHQVLLYLDEPSVELSDARSLAVVVLHIQRTHRTGAGVPDRSDHHDCLVLSQLCQYVHNHRLPELLDRVLGFSHADAGSLVPDRLLVDLQLALQRSVGSLYRLIEDQRTPPSFDEGVLQFLQLIREHQTRYGCCCCARVGPLTTTE